MTDWTVTIRVPDDEVTPEMMIGWEEELQGFDASVARPRDGEVTVHLHLSAPDAMKATCVAYDAVVDHVGRRPIEIETLTEAEFARRAEEPTLPELMSAAEIADELGVRRQRVHQLRHLAAFPAPLAELRGGAVWDAAAVRKFADNWTRKPGRPRSHTADSHHRDYALGN